MNLNMADEEIQIGADITAADMIDPIQVESEVKEFYKGAKVLITGGTGFIGRLIVEKLLRTCSDVSKVYILIRSKKGRDPQKRFEEMFSDIVFERLEMEIPNFYEKLFYVVGDLKLPNLGISDADRQKLIDDVDIIFHAGATVKFDEQLRTAAFINVRATKDLILLAKQMKQLRAFVHISTVFANCNQREIIEKFYDTPLTADKLLGMCDLLNDTQMDSITEQLKGDWPNTFTYTKAIAEDAVKTYGQNLPVTIVRPSIVISTSKEPVAGWINNYNGAVGVSLGIATGVMRALRCNPNNIAEIVPADYCINAAIVSAYLIAKTMRDNDNAEIVECKEYFEEIKVDNNIPIFNVVSSAENGITWHTYTRLFEQYGFVNPSMHCLWYYFLIVNTNKYMHMLCVYVFEVIPGYIIDFIAKIFGKTPNMMKNYKKLHKFSAVLAYFMLRQWIVRNTNTRSLWSQLNKTDQLLFNFNAKKLLWNEYFETYVKGARVYLLKDSLDTMPHAVSRYRKLKFAHYTIVTFVCSFLFYAIYSILL